MRRSARMLCGATVATMLVCTLARAAIVDGLQVYYPLDTNGVDMISSLNLGPPVNPVDGGYVSSESVVGGHLEISAVPGGENGGASREINGASDLNITDQFTISAWYKLRHGTSRWDLRGEKAPIAIGAGNPPVSPRDITFYNPDDGNQAGWFVTYPGFFGVTITHYEFAGLGMNNIPPSFNPSSCDDDPPPLDCTVESESDWYHIVQRVTADGMMSGWSTNINFLLLGDRNGDNVVDQGDVDVVLADWGEPGDASSDINNDEVVDQFDEDKVLEQFGYGHIVQVLPPVEMQMYGGVGSAWDGHTVVVGYLENKS